MNNKIQGRDNKSSRKRLETKLIIIKRNYITQENKKSSTIFTKS